MRFELVETPAEFQLKVNQALAKQINKYLRGIPKKIINRVKNSVRAVFEISDTYDSLLHGTLRGQFGFPTGTEVSFVEAVLKAIAKDIRIEYTPVQGFGADLIGGLDFYIVTKTLEDILSIEQASHTVESAKIIDYPNLDSGQPRKFKVEWLKWLLVDGDKVRVENFTFIHKFAGRSSHGIMAPTKKENSWFRVDPEFSGTIDFNWITRTLDEAKDFLANEWGTIIEQELTQ